MQGSPMSGRRSPDPLLAMQGPQRIVCLTEETTDVQYMLANTFSMPGRNLFASLSWSM